MLSSFGRTSSCFLLRRRAALSSQADSIEAASDLKSLKSTTLVTRLSSRIASWAETNGSVVAVFGSMFAAGAYCGVLINRLNAEQAARAKDIATERELRAKDVATEREMRAKDVDTLISKLGCERELRAKDFEMLSSKLSSAEHEIAQARSKRGWLVS